MFIGKFAIFLCLNEISWAETHYVSAHSTLYGTVTVSLRSGDGQVAVRSRSIHGQTAVRPGFSHGQDSLPESIYMQISQQYRFRSVSPVWTLLLSVSPVWTLLLTVSPVWTLLLTVSPVWTLLLTQSDRLLTDPVVRTGPKAYC